MPDDVNGGGQGGQGGNGSGGAGSQGGGDAGLKAAIKAALGEHLAPFSERFKRIEEAMGWGSAAQAAGPGAAGRPAGPAAAGGGSGGAATAQPDPAQQLQDLQLQVQRAAFAQAWPDSLLPERQDLAYKVLKADGRVVTRGGEHYVRLERNGQLVDVPLKQGLAEWAGTAEADVFSRPAPGGSGSQPARPVLTTTDNKVKAEQVLGQMFRSAQG